MLEFSLRVPDSWRVPEYENRVAAIDVHQRNTSKRGIYRLISFGMPSRFFSCEDRISPRTSRRRLS